jgi:hypothetical protein
MNVLIAVIVDHRGAGVPSARSRGHDRARAPKPMEAHLGQPQGVTAVTA